MDRFTKLTDELPLPFGNNRTNGGYRLCMRVLAMAAHLPKKIARETARSAFLLRGRSLLVHYADEMR